MSSVTGNLKRFRVEAGFTQRQVAEHLGISERGYQHYEAGDRKLPLEHLLSLTKLFRVSADHLLGNSAGFLRGITPDLVDLLAGETPAPVGEWVNPSSEDDEAAGDINEHNALVYTAHIRKFMKDMGISPECEDEFEAYVALLRSYSR